MVSGELVKNKGEVQVVKDDSQTPSLITVPGELNNKL